MCAWKLPTVDAAPTKSKVRANAPGYPYIDQNVPAKWDIMADRGGYPGAFARTFDFAVTASTPGQFRAYIC